MSNIGSEILQGLNEALAYVKGEATLADYRVHVPESIDVKAIRAQCKMTQQEFANSFGFSVTTLRHWEQGRRKPEGPTRAYLLVIERKPEAVQEALHGTKPRRKRQGQNVS